MPDQKDHLNAGDFPVETDSEKLRTQNGNKIGSGASKALAEDIADRLNENAHRDEEDRWSA